MKREIKFRAKRVDNGEWIYGDLTTKQLSPRFCGDHCIFDGGWYAVDPVTIGQYTEIQDYNGKEIYEGDILESNSLNMPEILKVSFKNGSFVLVHNKKIIDSIWRYDSDMFDVIGNTHDNPELLNTNTDDTGRICDL